MTIIMLCRRCFSWRTIGLIIVIITITLMGLLTVQNSQCTLISTYKNTVIKSPYLGSHREKPGLFINSEQCYWLDNLVTLNVTDQTSNRYLLPVTELRTHNLSKLGNDWFEILPDESYLKDNATVFIRGDQIKNNFSDNFLINGETICQGNTPFILVIIPSVVGNSEQRDAIRWSWLAAAESGAWPGTFIKEKIKHIFLFGVKDDKQSDDYKKLMEESYIFRDIVMADFVDTYRNLSRKIITGLFWARKYCKHAKFVLKADEDTFINIPVMIELLQHVHEKIGNESFVIGMQHNYNQPHVVRDGHWGVTKEEFPLDFYPKYMYGHSYVVNNQALISITDVAKYVTLIAPEDAFVTGILPKFAGVLRISAPSFTVCCRSIFDCEVVWNERVALPEIKSAKLLAQLWANVITHSCSSTKSFIG